MLVQLIALPSTHPNHDRTKKVAVLECDVCSMRFERSVNVKKWLTAARHRCSPECFRLDSKKGGAAYEQRKNTCLEKYGVASVVAFHASSSGKKAHTEEIEKRRWKKIREAWQKNSVRRSRGLELTRSKAELEFIHVCTSILGPCVPQKYVNGWFIDAYFAERDLYVQFDGVYWHSSPKIFNRDEAQNAWFKANNLKLERVTDLEWRKNPERVLTRLFIVQ